MSQRLLSFLMIILLFSSCKAIKDWNKLNKAALNETQNPKRTTPVFKEELGISALDLEKYKDYQQIHLYNPSFEEGRSGFGIVPKGWLNCGDKEHSPPDIHSSFNAHFGVEQMPVHGQHFLGLICRADRSKEGLSQKLPKLLKAGNQYLLSMFLAQSSTLSSPSKITLMDELYNEPVQLSIWGSSTSFCAQEELLGTTSFVDHEDWKPYDFQLNPTMDFTYITIEILDSNGFKRGNILIDGISPIINLSSKLAD